MTAKPPARRCGVYTRKSSEEGLEQDFNSLHAQREACEAFIRSQRSEGWRLIEIAYDDGGLSGGSLERPALQRLFADIARHQVDTVVVYKVDRLTRSLMDFAKIVELFDRHGTSFVAVTQSKPFADRVGGTEAAARHPLTDAAYPKPNRQFPTRDHAPVWRRKRRPGPSPVRFLLRNAAERIAFPARSGRMPRHLDWLAEGPVWSEPVSAPRFPC